MAYFAGAGKDCEPKKQDIEEYGAHRFIAKVDQGGRMQKK